MTRCGSYGIGLTDIRCPSCGRLQFRMQGDVPYLQRKCRCKAMVEVMGHSVIATTNGAMVMSR